MKFNFLGYLVVLESANKLTNANIAKRRIVLNKIKIGLILMRDSNIKYTEYQLQKYSNVSINSIKKYRKEIQDITKDIS